MQLRLSSPLVRVGIHALSTSLTWMLSCFYWMHPVTAETIAIRSVPSVALNFIGQVMGNVTELVDSLVAPLLYPFKKLTAVVVGCFKKK